MAVEIQTIREDQSDVIKPEGTVLLKFGAAWCGPCKMSEPHVVELAEQSEEGSLSIFSIDVDSNPGLTSRYKVRGIPSFILLRDGAEVSRITGAVNKARLESLVAGS